MTTPTDGLRLDLDALAELAERLRKAAERCKEAADGETLVGRDTARMAQYRLEEAADAIDMARRAVVPSEKTEPVGEAVELAGLDNCTYAVFQASKVPIGTKLYLQALPPQSPLGATGEARVLSDHLRGVMSKIYNRGHSGLELGCPLCQAYIACDRLLALETGGAPSEEVLSWDRRAGIEQAIAEIRELVPDECKPEDDSDNQAGFRDAIDHVLQILAPLAAAPTDRPGADRAGIIEECAKVVEANEIMDGPDGQFLRPRSDGNRAGLAYAAAIRSLSPKESR